MAVGFIPVAIDSRTVSEVPPEQFASLADSEWMPCSVRIPILQVAVSQLPAQVSIPAGYAAADLDERCVNIAQLQADFELQEKNVELADRATLASITYNPNDPASWTLRARYHLLAGDLAAAESDYAKAAELIARIPDGSLAQSLLDSLRADLDAAQAQAH